ncbi:DUF1987 domain-containing protein [Thioalkalivibrio sp. ALE28]|uniref:DUF1987 domain-containing protein n=1 Tax=Thioalkalivibrio sp. ALE28 TaxID=1158179 RepID=UPI000382C1D8|nr:DUF1987 domain-containing protein [Thioalkalivibrio sp. ALE28]
MAVVETIEHEATDRTPAVQFDFAAGQYRLSGESYPEDAANFYGPLTQGLRQAIEDGASDEVEFTVEMIYFNSSTAKALMNMFQILEDGAEAGLKVRINWCYHEDDETMEEFGEDFSEDFEHADYRMCPLT